MAWKETCYKWSLILQKAFSCVFLLEFDHELSAFLPYFCFVTFFSILLDSSHQQGSGLQLLQKWFKKKGKRLCPSLRYLNQELTFIIKMGRTAKFQTDTNLAHCKT